MPVWNISRPRTEYRVQVRAMGSDHQWPPWTNGGQNGFFDFTSSLSNSAYQQGAKQSSTVLQEERVCLGHLRKGLWQEGSGQPLEEELGEEYEESGVADLRQQKYRQSIREGAGKRFHVSQEELYFLRVSLGKSIFLALTGPIKFPAVAEMGLRSIADLLMRRRAKLAQWLDQLQNKACKNKRKHARWALWP